ncbi:hypothetical protein ACFL2H_04145, partial [Planctomycetota bacterium]
TSQTSHPEPDIRLRQNDVELAEVKLDRAATRLESLKRTNQKVSGAVSGTSIQDAEYDIRQAELELQRAQILAEQANHQTNVNTDSPANGEQASYMRRMLENQLQQAQTMADQQAKLTAIAKTRFESGTETQETLIEAQAKQKVAALEVEKLQIQLDAQQLGIDVTSQVQTPTSTSGLSAAESLRRSLSDSLAQLHEDISVLQKADDPYRTDFAPLVERLEAAQKQAVKLSSLKRRADTTMLQLNLMEAKRGAQILHDLVRDLDIKQDLTEAEIKRINEAKKQLLAASSKVSLLESQLKELSRSTVDEAVESTLAERSASLAAQIARLAKEEERLSILLEAGESNEAERVLLESQLAEIRDQIKELTKQHITAKVDVGLFMADRRLQIELLQTDLNEANRRRADQQSLVRELSNKLNAASEADKRRLADASSLLKELISKTGRLKSKLKAIDGKSATSDFFGDAPEPRPVNQTSIRTSSEAEKVRRILIDNIARLEATSKNLALQETRLSERVSSDEFSQADEKVLQVARRKLHAAISAHEQARSELNAFAKRLDRQHNKIQLFSPNHNLPERMAEEEAKLAELLKDISNFLTDEMPKTGDFQ